jgi:hypothetical protein
MFDSPAAKRLLRRGVRQEINCHPADKVAKDVSRSSRGFHPKRPEANLFRTMVAGRPGEQTFVEERRGWITPVGAMSGTCSNEATNRIRLRSTLKVTRPPSLSAKQIFYRCHCNVVQQRHTMVNQLDRDEIGQETDTRSTHGTTVRTSSSTKGFSERRSGGMGHTDAFAARRATNNSTAESRSGRGDASGLLTEVSFPFSPSYITKYPSYGARSCRDMLHATDLPEILATITPTFLKGSVSVTSVPCIRPLELAG